MLSPEPEVNPEVLRQSPDIAAEIEDNIAQEIKNDIQQVNQE